MWQGFLIVLGTQLQQFQLIFFFRKATIFTGKWKWHYKDCNVLIPKGTDELQNREREGMTQNSDHLEQNLGLKKLHILCLKD